MPFLPATQFCCGCSVNCGVKFILVLNMLLNVFLISAICANLIWMNPGFHLASYEVEICGLLIALAGLPCIIAAWNGVIYRNEVAVRMYLYYMNCIFAMLLSLVFYQFVWKAGCKRLPIKNSFQQGTVCGASGMFFKTGGQAFACGVAHLLDFIIAIMTLCILGYFQHVVWSFVEDLNAPPTEYYYTKYQQYEKARHHNVSTELHAPAQAGETKLNVKSNSGFLKNKQIVIERGTQREEVNYVKEMGDFTLWYPLQYEHDVLSTVSQEGVWEQDRSGSSTLKMPAENPSGNYAANEDLEPNEVTNLLMNKRFYQTRHQPGGFMSPEILSSEDINDPDSWFKRDWAQMTSQPLDRAMHDGSCNPGNTFFGGRYHEMGYPPKGASVADLAGADLEGGA